MKEVKIVDCETIKEDKNLLYITVMKVKNADAEIYPVYGIARDGFKKENISTNIYEVAKFVDDFNKSNKNIGNNSLMNEIEAKFFS